jgi:hypothetical protein
MSRISRGRRALHDRLAVRLRSAEPAERRALAEADGADGAKG